MRARRSRGRPLQPQLYSSFPSDTEGNVPLRGCSAAHGGGSRTLILPYRLPALIRLTLAASRSAVPSAPAPPMLPAPALGKRPPMDGLAFKVDP